VTVIIYYCTHYSVTPPKHHCNTDGEWGSGVSGTRAVLAPARGGGNYTVVTLVLHLCYTIVTLSFTMTVTLQMSRGLPLAPATRLHLLAQQPAARQFLAGKHRQWEQTVREDPGDGDASL
jgi:hypothetical protein